MRVFRKFTLLAQCCAIAAAMPAIAQDEAAPAVEEAAVAGSVLTGNVQGRSFPPSYFEQFGPRNALDMVKEIPGFSISGDGDGGRGLGQASQNVLINGERLSSKSDSARDQLGRIPAGNVVAIELVDGTALDIPGLTGQVVNVIVESTGFSGQFTYEGAFRTTSVDPELYGGEISVTGSSGALDYTLSLGNNNNRFGADGTGFIRAPDGVLLRTDEGEFVGSFDRPTFTANLGYEIAPTISANLNLTYLRTYFRRSIDEFQSGTQFDDRTRTIRTGEDGYEYELGGDLTFPIGAGTMKLIALEAFDSEDFGDTLTDDFVDRDLVSKGGRFTRGSGEGERIGRFEYNWPMWGADWQLSGEAAFNRLDRVSGLFQLAPDGSFTEIDFPAGTGGVTEDRYESIVSFSRSLTPRLALQATAGGEYSQISQTGSAANSRSFQRPKGSLSLAWNVGSGLDISMEVARTVGQLSFGDFLARVDLDDGNDNAGNNELVPQQAWGVDVEANKSLGAWGSTSLEIEQRWIEDYVALVPFAGGGEGRGNVDRARRIEVEWNTTLKLDPLGIAGAQLDIELELARSRLDDPLTGEPRAFSGDRDRLVDLDYRHDLPRSDWAYGAGLRYSRNGPYFRLSEIGREREGPTFANLFVENKDVLGLTLRATYGNVLGGRDLFERTVFDGPRDGGSIAFTENRDRRIGPIFRFSVAGNF